MFAYMWKETRIPVKTDLSYVVITCPSHMLTPGIETRWQRLVSGYHCVSLYNSFCMFNMHAINVFPCFHLLQWRYFRLC